MNDRPEPFPPAIGAFRSFGLKMLVVLFAMVYTLPARSLWGKTHFPESFGIQVNHGRGDAVERWYYSYLLLGRGNFWDVLTFLYMWAPLLGFVAWFGWPLLRGAMNRKERLP